MPTAHHYANVHRGIYELSEDATTRFEAARRKVAALPLARRLSAKIVFVRNATEAINLVAYSWGRTHAWQAGRSGRDHPAGAPRQHRSWQQLTKEVGAQLDDAGDHRRRPAGHGRPDAPVADKGSQAAGGGGWSATRWALSTRSPRSWRWPTGPALALVDAAQGAPHMPIDIKAYWAATSWPSKVTRCLARRASGALWARWRAAARHAAVHDRRQHDHSRHASSRLSGTKGPASSRRARRPSRKRSAWARPSTT